MEVKQLELFKDTDFNGMKTFIKKHGGWYLFDNIRDRKDFSANKSNRYRAVCKIGHGIYDNESCEAHVTLGDEQAKLIGIYDYFKLACYMRINGYIYNKKKCELELKNGKG